MKMIGHEAVGEQVYFFPMTFVLEKIEITEAILIVAEDRFAVVSAMTNVKRFVNDDFARLGRHRL